MQKPVKKDPPYFMYFPGNYRWSAAILSMLSSAPWGGAQHCMRDYLSLGVAEMWNWLEDKLLRS